ncbi:transcriptional regulator [Pandoraea capi]|uniref:Transcriptional regulator n=1 Tax=Pandoraea capi TaxID=2508286 RepID=A0ABY6W3A1_9BURK|nr:Rrf2 family transcriptional regulator [Pandoraea capi]VVE20587.1 transcriptional regulator [Pandoraea capi]
MSYISTGVEYSLHCLLYLADSSAGVRDASVRDLAEMQGIPVEYAAKLFTRLSKAGLVMSTEGVRGGYSLAKNSHEITVHDVIVAIDGEKALFDCREVRRQCAVFDGDPPAWASKGKCSISAVMASAEAVMRAELQKHTLADLAAGVNAKAPAAYGKRVITWFDERAAARRGH